MTGLVLQNKLFVISLYSPKAHSSHKVPLYKKKHKQTNNNFIQNIAKL